MAHKVVSDNVRVAGRVASLQADFEKPTTELYRYLVKDSDFEDDLKTSLSTIQFKLPRPRILANQNTSEALNTAYQNAQTVVNVKVGEDATTDDDMMIKRKMTELLVRNETPYIDWSVVDRIYDQACIEVQKEKVKKAADENLKNGLSDQSNPTDDLSGLEM